MLHHPLPHCKIPDPITEYLVRKIVFPCLVFQFEAGVCQFLVLIPFVYVQIVTLPPRQKYFKVENTKAMNSSKVEYVYINISRLFSCSMISQEDNFTSRGVHVLRDKKPRISFCNISG